MLTKFLDEKDYPSIGTHGCKARCPLDVEVWEDCADVPEVIDKLPDLEHEKYFVSNFGNFIAKKKNKILYRKQTMVTDGYLSASISHKNVRMQIRIHRLVFSAFGVANKNSTGYCINHIDTNKKNNRIDNLELVTQLENMNNTETRLKLSKGKCLLVFADTNEVFREFLSALSAAKFLGMGATRNTGLTSCIYSCFIMLTDYRQHYIYDENKRRQKYFFVNGNRSTVFNCKELHKKYDHYYTKLIAVLKHGEECTFEVKKGKNKGKTTVYRLTCKEIYEYIAKDKIERNREDKEAVERKKKEDYMNKEWYSSLVRKKDFLAYLQVTPQILEDFNRYKALLAANNQAS